MSSVSLYNTDCYAFMKTMADNSIDLIVTDPPYDIAHSGGGGVTRERDG